MRRHVSLYGLTFSLPLLIWQQSSVVFNWPMAAVISIVLLSAVLVCLAIFNLLGKKSMRYLNV